METHERNNIMLEGRFLKNAFLNVIHGLNKIYTKMINRFLLIFIIFLSLFLTACTVEPMMSKAGIMTHPSCAKFSSEDAVATCEAGLKGSSGSRFSFGVGFSRNL